MVGISRSHLFLNEEEKASLLLSKSKTPEDAFLAAKLLKYYQPERAVELVVECVKRNLSSSNFQQIEEIFTEFPEVKVRAGGRLLRRTNWV